MSVSYAYMCIRIQGILLLKKGASINGGGRIIIIGECFGPGAIVRHDK